MGVRNHANIVHIIDFSLVKQFRSHDMHLHIPFHGGLGITGTLLFASNNSHASWELDRQDNFESLAYILIYFMYWNLPWGHFSDPAIIAQQKLGCSVEKLCWGLPTEFTTFLSYSCSLQFEDKPVTVMSASCLTTCNSMRDSRMMLPSIGFHYPQ